MAPLTWPVVEHREARLLYGAVVACLPALLRSWAQVGEEHDPAPTLQGHHLCILNDACL